MIHIATELATLVPAAPSPVPDTHYIHYLTNQVEWFYGEMFIGMTVLYAFVAAVFGYFIPRHNLKALHERIDTDAASIKQVIEQQQAAMERVRQETQRELGKIHHFAGGTLLLARGLNIFLSGLLPSRPVQGGVDEGGKKKGTIILSAIELLGACHLFFLAEDFQISLNTMSEAITALRAFGDPPSFLLDQRLRNSIRQVQEDFAKLRADHADVVEAAQAVKEHLRDPHLQWFLDLPAQ